MAAMKSILEAFSSSALGEHYRRFRRSMKHASNRQRRAEEVFTEIYEKNIWGGKPGEFCSGAGTSDARLSEPYFAAIEQLARSEGFGGKTFVDIGCGDFAVGRRLRPLCGTYIGVDIVRSLVARNMDEFGNPTTNFVHRNISTDPLPAGDVCIVRQVLQHLSNEQIAAVLRKVASYRWVLITEHYPNDNDSIVPNKDQAHGDDIRVLENSGVYICEPPFNLPKDAVTLVCEVQVGPRHRDYDPGVIRTYCYKPG
jgi:hypothetical protein